MGAVILNRIEHPSFPDTLSGVIYQKGAFSCLYDGQFYEPIADSAYSAARDAINGLDPSGGAIYYYNPSTRHKQVDILPSRDNHDRRTQILQLIAPPDRLLPTQANRKTDICTETVLAYLISAA